MKKEFKSFELEMLSRSLEDICQGLERELPKMAHSETYAQALKSLSSFQSSALCVLDDSHKLCGILTERDLLKFYFSEEFSDQALVSSFMTPRPHGLKASDDLKSALLFFKKYGVRSLPVTNDEGALLQLLTTFDILKIMIQNFEEELSEYGAIRGIDIMEIQAQEEDFSLSLYEQQLSETLDSHLFMTPIRRVYSKKALRVDQALTLEECAKKMASQGLSALVIVRYETQLQGILTERDLVVKYLAASAEDNAKLSLEQAMTARPRCVLARHNLAQALNTMSEIGCRQLIVVDEDQVPIGLVHLIDVLSFFAQALQRIESKA